MLENEKRVNCPRCKGEGIIRGQEIARGKRLPNYKHVQDGDCFVCNATGKVYLIDGKFIGISHFNKNKLVEYDSKGKCIGPYTYNASVYSDVEFIHDEKNYTKKDLLNIEKRYQSAIKDMITKPLNIVFNSLVDIYNDEECIIEFINVKNKPLDDFKNENHKTICLINKVLKTNLSKDKVEKLELLKYYADSRLNRILAKA